VQTTVGLELGGTTTVVLFCGGGGLLLLIHPDSAASMHSDAKTIFMVRPLECVLHVEQEVNFAHVGDACLSSRNGTDGRLDPTLMLPRAGGVGRVRQQHRIFQSGGLCSRRKATEAFSICRRVSLRDSQ
jgi:hypothetical protein